MKRMLCVVLAIAPAFVWAEEKVAAPAPAAPTAQISIEDFVKKPDFEEMAISPGGRRRLRSSPSCDFTVRGWRR